jgi:hypothetical protein
MFTVAVAVPPSASVTVYEKESVPLKFAFGEYVTEAPAPGVTVPLVADPYVNVSAATAVSMSLTDVARSTVTAVSSAVVTAASAAVGRSLTDVTVTVTVAVAVNPGVPVSVTV